MPHPRQALLRAHAFLQRLPAGTALVPVLALVAFSVIRTTQPVFSWPWSHAPRQRISEPSPPPNEPPAVTQTASADPATLAEQLHQHVSVLADPSLPRDAAHPENLDRTAALIYQHFRLSGLTPDEQMVGPRNGTAYKNIMASVGPLDSPSRIVVGAHYDAYHEHPGADDNASGVAGLLALASLLKGSEDSLRRRVDLVAYTLEEPPFFGTAGMGSAVHAQTMRAQGVRIDAMICLEMIGYFSDAAGSQELPNPLLKPFYPSQGNFIAVVGRPEDNAVLRAMKREMSAATALPVYSFSGPASVTGVDFSDHRNYWVQGYPAVMVTDTSFFRNRRYHTKDDTADSLDYVRMAKVVHGVFAAIKRMAIHLE